MAGSSRVLSSVVGRTNLLNFWCDIFVQVEFRLRGVLVYQVPGII